MANTVAREVEVDTQVEELGAGTLKVQHDQSLIARILTSADAALDPATLIDKFVDVLKRLRTAAIRFTLPEDWVIHTGKDKSGKVIARGYLQDIGAQRAGKVFGVGMSAPRLSKEDGPDGTYSYVAHGSGWSHVTGERIEGEIGSRWSGDKFFTGRGGEAVDPSDVMKAAVANLHGRIVRSLCGLSGVSLDYLKECGIDTAKVVMVDYAAGAQGGAGESADFEIRFGRMKGKKVSEITDVEQLKYYIGGIDKDMNDPAKARFKDKNEKERAILQARIDTLQREAEQPAGKTEGEGGEGVATPANGETPKNKGEKLTLLQKQIQAARGKVPMQKALHALLAAVEAPKADTLSAVAEADLDKLLALGGEPGMDPIIAAAE